MDLTGGSKPIKIFLTVWRLLIELIEEVVAGEVVEVDVVLPCLLGGHLPILSTVDNAEVCGELILLLTTPAFGPSGIGT